MLLKKKALLSVALVITMICFFSFAALAQEGEVEVFSWWTGGGEEEGLHALIELFNDEYPDVEFINATVAGGAGANAKAVLKTRMVGGNPPDSFQVHGGAELIDTYVETGMMEPITDLYDEWGVRDAFNPQILDMVSHEGEIYSVPVNVHRSNVMFYNNAVLAEHGVQPPDNDVESFLAVLEELSETDVVPLALGDTNRWPATQIFEGLLVATLGSEGYNGLWDGNTAADDPAVREALVYFDRMMEYVNADHSSLTWQDATQMMQEGEAAFNIMGDWSEGYLKTLGWTPGEEFGWQPLPGSGGTFIVITDTFGLPMGAPNPENAKRWLEIIASREGQDIFNPIKGSIPARIDADTDKYGPYLTDAMNDFANDDLSPSIAHGSAAPEGFMTALDDTINEFISTGDVDQAFRSFQANVADYVE